MESLLNRFRSRDRDFEERLDDFKDREDREIRRHVSSAIDESLDELRQSGVKPSKPTGNATRKDS